MESEQLYAEQTQTFVNYEQLGEAKRIPLSKTAFIEVVAKRAVLPNGAVRDFVMISRGYVTKSGGVRTERFITVPASATDELARLLSVGGLDTIDEPQTTNYPFSGA